MALRMAFEGFDDPDAKFFRALAKNQNKDWFQAHKTEFEEGWHAPMKALLGEVREAVDSAFPHVDLDEPKIFRIYRDVRFSKDKSPYKTHLGGLVDGFYVGLDASGVTCAGGFSAQAADQLARYRAAVTAPAPGQVLEKVLADLKTKGHTGFITLVSPSP